MSEVTFSRDGAALRGFDQGSGIPLLFQHGLGGSAAQVDENVPDLPGFRRLTLECRAQGGSNPCRARPFTIAMFTDDALVFCDARAVQSFVAGGISMGAAIALRLAVLRPERVRALILARPAWAFEPAPQTMQPYRDVAAALRGFAPMEAKARFEASPMAAFLAREAPDNLASLLGFFARPDPDVTAELLDQIAVDGPGISRAQAEALKVPTLVIGHGIDHAHPLALAKLLAETIPGAQFVEIPPKATDRTAHVAAFRDAVARFLASLALSKEFSP